MTKIGAMETESERIAKLDMALITQQDVCGSGGIIGRLPERLYTPTRTDHITLISCHKGWLKLTVDHHQYQINAGETATIDRDALMEANETSPDMAVTMLCYRVEPIRDMLGATVMPLRLIEMLSPIPCRVWHTGGESDISHYMALLSATSPAEPSVFADHEQKLLLMALTYRLCSLFSRHFGNAEEGQGRKTETFIALIKLVSQHFDQERSVAYYADKLCLSPKYLSSLVKSICGYTVQEIIFKAIVRRSIFLMKNTNKPISEIADLMHFPNASAFGTFFKKQTGLSPRAFRIKVKR